MTKPNQSPEPLNGRSVDELLVHISALKAALAAREAEVAKELQYQKTLQGRINGAVAEVARLRGALEFYADRNNHRIFRRESGGFETGPMLSDKGEKARQALAPAHSSIRDFTLQPLTDAEQPVSLAPAQKEEA